MYKLFYKYLRLHKYSTSLVSLYNNFDSRKLFSSRISSGSDEWPIPSIVKKAGLDVKCCDNSSLVFFPHA